MHYIDKYICKYIWGKGKAELLRVGWCFWSLWQCDMGFRLYMMWIVGMSHYLLKNWWDHVGIDYPIIEERHAKRRISCFCPLLCINFQKRTLVSPHQLNASGNNANCKQKDFSFDAPQFQISRLGNKQHVSLKWNDMSRFIAHNFLKSKSLLEMVSSHEQSL